MLLCDLCELRQKEIINTCTCRCLGCPIDVEFDCKTGQHYSAGGSRTREGCAAFFGRESEYVIPWKCICQIGDDIILVQIQEEKCFRKEHLT